MIPFLLYLWLEASRLGVDPGVANCVCWRESRYEVQAVGDNGRALGLWQWHLPSWQQARREMGLSEEDLRADPTESTRTALWAFSRGYGHWWSTWGRCQEEIK